MAETMPLRLAAALLAAAFLAGCDSSPHKMSAEDVERLLEGKNGPNVICTKGTDGWDYSCKTVHRKIGVDVYDNGTAELSSWTPIDEPLAVGPGGEGPAVRARFVDEANAICNEARSMVARLTPPVSKTDALARLDQVRDLRFLEVGELSAIKPPAVLSADYVSMVGGIGALQNDEMQLRTALAAGSGRRDAVAARRRDALKVKHAALRVGLRACANSAMPIPGIVR